MSDYLDFCLRQGCLPDVLTVRSFNAEEPGNEKSDIKLVESGDAFHMAVSGDERYLASNLNRVRTLLAKKGLGQMPVMLDEWSNNVWQRDLCNDTCYKSAYLFKNILENYDSFYAMGYFNACDRLDELPPSSEVFCGGFGLFTHNGLPKSAMRALELLAKAGDELLAQGDGYFICADRGEIQIYLYNYSHYDTLYRYRHTTNLTKTDRYHVLNACMPQAYHIKLDMLKPGDHTVRRYSISQAGGSSFDAWVEMGAPDEPTSDELCILQSKSHPVYHTEKLNADHGLVIQAALAPLEVQLITVTR